MAPVLIKARFTFMKQKYRIQNKMGFFTYILLQLVTWDSINDLFDSGHAPCDRAF
jgi:hypothetical protein